MTALTPAEPRERVAVLDVLRALALLGVLLGNTFRLYSGGFVGALGREYEPTALDEAAGWFINLVVQSKAQTLLTFLFGFGFAAQLLRAQERGEPVLGLYTRRLLALGAFGVAHIALLWWGDVLWTYAVAGFGMLLFLRASNRTRVIAAVLLIFVPTIIMRLPGMWERMYTLLYPPGSFPAYAHDLLAAMRGSDHAELLWQHIRFAPVFSAGGFYSYELWLLGRFLLGYVAGALRWFERDGAEHQQVFRRILLGGALAGAAGAVSVVMSMLGVFRDLEASTARAVALAVLRELDFLGLAAVYLAGTVLLFQRPRWRRVLEVLVPAGRMPLTVYLSQSLIMTSLLYGWGLGLNEVIAPAGYVALSFAVFAVQVIACRLWLRRFRYGPFEWAWRALVYMRLPPMRA